MAEKPIEYSVGIVAFIDILGWKKVVDRSETDAQLLGRLYGVLERVKTRIIEQIKCEGYSAGVHAHQFSDAHFLTLAVDDGETSAGPEFVALWCRLLAREYLRENLLVRGGITIGKFIDDGFSCFGPAVTKAYKLEQEISDPMVVIDPREKIQKIFLDPEQYGGVKAESSDSNCMELRPYTMSPLAKTHDGHVFIDYLRNDVSSNNDLKPHDVLDKEEINAIIERFETFEGVPSSARSKVEWFLQYARGDWRQRDNGFIREITFEPKGMVRRRLCRDDYLDASM